MSYTERCPVVVMSMPWRPGEVSARREASGKLGGGLPSVSGQTSDGSSLSTQKGPAACSVDLQPFGSEAMKRAFVRAHRASTSPPRERLGGGGAEGLAGGYGDGQSVFLMATWK